MLLKLRYYGDPFLRKKCRRVEEITPEIRQLVSDMVETVDQFNGIGLAAPQVGQDLALFVLRNYITDEKGHLSVSEPLVFINPEICFVSKETCIEEEGCLSIPKLRGSVVRPEKIVIEAVNLEGKHFKEELEGYNARVRLHENDHLNGVLFIDRLDPKERKKVEHFLKEIKRRYQKT